MADEGRRFDRVQLPIDARCRPYGALTESWKSIRLLDLSASGVRFEGDALLEEANQIELQMLIPASQKWFVIRGIVIWSKPLEAGVVESGVKFDDLNVVDSEQLDEMVQFLKKQPKPPSSGEDKE